MSALWLQEVGTVHHFEGVLLLIVSFLVTAVHFMMEPLRWNHCYLPSADDIRSRNGIRDALFCTALATYLLPFKLGIPLRILLLHRQGKLTFHFIGVAIALDGLLSLIAWSLMAALSLWLAALHWRPPAYVWGIAIAAIIGILVIFWLLRRLRNRWMLRLREALMLLDRPWRRILTAWTILVGDVASYGIRHALLVLMVTGDPHIALIGGAIGIVATFAGIVSGLPMGLVGYDATLIALLALAGVPLDRALLVALFNRGLNLGAAVLLGLPAAMRLRLGTNLGSILRRLRKMGSE